MLYFLFLTHFFTLIRSLSLSLSPTQTLSLKNSPRTKNSAIISVARSPYLSSVGPTKVHESPL